DRRKRRPLLGGEDGGFNGAFEVEVAGGRRVLGARGGLRGGPGCRAGIRHLFVASIGRGHRGSGGARPGLGGPAGASVRPGRAPRAPSLWLFTRLVRSSRNGRACSLRRETVARSRAFAAACISRSSCLSCSPFSAVHWEITRSRASKAVFKRAASASDRVSAA